MTFSVTDPATWPVLLTVEQYAAIRQLTVSAVRDRVRRGRCVPAPMLRPGTLKYEKPLRWRKADVVPYVLGTASNTRRVG